MEQKEEKITIIGELIRLIRELTGSVMRFNKVFDMELNRLSKDPNAVMFESSFQIEARKWEEERKLMLKNKNMNNSPCPQPSSTSISSWFPDADYIIKNRSAIDYTTVNNVNINIEDPWASFEIGDTK